MKNIAFGQYYPARSPLHALDARIKVLLSVLYIVAAFLCKSATSFAVLLASAILLMALSRIPPRIVLRSIRPLLFVMVFTALLNLFFTGGETLLWSWGIFHIYVESIYSAVFMLVRIMVLIFGTSLFLTYTTTPIALTDAIESLLAPLRVLRLPVHEFAMMMSIALRFIPTLSEETYKIMSAQRARGVDFSSGGLIKRARALVPILIPLIISSFRRADELAMAMECRCYRGGVGRTKMRARKLAWYDVAALLPMLAFGAGLVLLNRYGFSL
ncbi:MAG: energy-coupling factor transporter transmembrane protein EcfT [Clostridia bacterium]|nr:energy-coupling factor transporter transmembrane protein EcfT [Clostridia bacterium]